MLRTRSLALLCFLLVATIPLTPAAADDTTPTLVANAHVGRRDGGFWLDLEITNASNKHLKLAHASIPWLCSASIVVMADAYAPGRAPRELDVRTPWLSSRCPDDVTTLEPGRSLAGGIDLDRRIEGLSAALENRNVVVFWYWRSPEDAGESAGRGGHAVLRSGAADAPAAPDEPTSDGASSIGVAAHAFDDGDGSKLGFSLSNEGSANVSIGVGELPWGLPQHTSVRAAVLDPQRALSGRRHRPHLLTATQKPWTTIPPGGIHVGTLAMAARVHAFDEARKEGDVVVFWFTALESTGQASLGEHGGFVVFPKRGGGS